MALIIKMQPTKRLQGKARRHCVASKLERSADTVCVTVCTIKVIPRPAKIWTRPWLLNYGFCPNSASWDLALDRSANRPSLMFPDQPKQPSEQFNLCGRGLRENHRDKLNRYYYKCRAFTFFDIFISSLLLYLLLCTFYA
ncbi:hypothetical protein P692DRAFT_2052953 [Suillus brevipes Sb2]|nr:hypothetical protein P692DRAFT_2052953 [Suillus brevipes Sb2]